ncbi:MAG: hypothetical protein C4519_21380 [Desulfobacteraceae bacterium]|nr:MAG: hypothetical protein C4519_21380 [Desulfobacteraceae bacterium]
MEIMDARDSQKTALWQFGELTLTTTTIFIIRALLGVFFGILLTRFFYPEASIAFIIGLSAVLVALSYLSTYFRRPRK